MQSLELNAKFLGHVFQLRRMFKNTNVAEVRITATTIAFLNPQEEPAYLTFSQDITTNPFSRAMETYLADLRQTEISSRYPEPTPEGTCIEKLKSICTVINASNREQETDENPEVEEKLRQEIPGKKGKFALKTASRTYQLYQARGFFNLLGNKSITANVLYQMAEEDFQLLLREAREIRTEELSELLNESFAGAQE
ncbi:hypothetical protein C2G38_2050292 [Gigaspora rosea]|uniref:Uncharacterized protein n=1 Tax=Gigaspora rosea TaxID=44941 RepID=A0A397TVS1_9GLOM|nr:hypothetical protein C2G38_2050292 [Gigaspora rosea]